MIAIRWLGLKMQGIGSRPGAEDTGLAIGLLIAGLLPLRVRGLDLGELPETASLPLVVVLTAGLSLPLCVRRIYPVGAALIIASAWVVTQFTGAPVGVAGLGLLIAIYSVAAHQRRYREAAIIAGTAAYVLVAITLSMVGSAQTALDYVTFFVVLLVPWLIGRLVRSSALLQEERRRHAAEAAVQGVLRALALDLHDVVTHHVTAIVVQAESAAYLHEADRGGRDETLKVIATAGRRALDELRELLGAINPNTGDSTTKQQPVPDVISFVRQLGHEGHPVSLETTGEPVDLSNAVNATLYRCAQEAITNALNHGNGGTIRVGLTQSPSMIELTISNSLGTQAITGRASGRGLGNMRHRMELVGGTMTAQIVDNNFEVAVRLPLKHR